MFIKVPKSFFVRSMAKGDTKFLKSHRTFGNINIRADVSYKSDEIQGHKLDIIYPAEYSNGITILLIHGGGYIYGWKEASHVFASYFVSKGFTVVVMNYRLADHKQGITFKEQIHDIFWCLNFLRKYRTYYKLDTDHLCLMGDSAGGHLAIMTDIIYNDKEAQDFFGIKNLPDVKIKCVCTNSPMYDYPAMLEMAKKICSKKLVKDLFSSDYKNEYYIEHCSSRYYFKKKIKLEPIFANTSLHDFFNSQTYTLKRDCDELKCYDLDYFCEMSPDKKIGHVYNHFIFDKEGKYCNDRMIEFMLKNVKN